jgi:hypothetical protein
MWMFNTLWISSFSLKISKYCFPDISDIVERSSVLLAWKRSIVTFTPHLETEVTQRHENSRLYNNVIVPEVGWFLT